MVVQAALKAFSMNRMDVTFYPLPKRPEYNEIVSKPYFIHETPDLYIKINTRTGRLDEYCVGGRPYLKENSFSLRMTDDTYNAWGFGKDESACQRFFQILTPKKGSSFSGLKEIIPSIRMIEDGPVRTVIEAVFGLEDSYAYIRYKLPKKGTAFEVEVMVQFSEKEQSLKLILNTMAEKQSKFEGQIMFGRELLDMNGKEAVAQKWAMVSDEVHNQALLIMNNGTYGLNYENGSVGITLLRSAGYSAADDGSRKAYEEKQYAPRMEQGERYYHFMIDSGSLKDISDRADNQALVFNEKPYGFSYCPLEPEPGQQTFQESFLTIDNPSIVVSTLKKAEESDDFILRVYESSGQHQRGVIKSNCLGIYYDLILKPNEIKTLKLTKNNIQETNLLEEII